jgi:Nucleotide modification associated domain 1
MKKTLQQYDAVIERCKALFIKKTSDYGTAWRILRPSSLTDQLFIKARRIRQIEETGMQQIADKIDDEYVGLVNYAILAQIQLELPPNTSLELTPKHAIECYDAKVQLTRDLMMAKNSDYGEVWRDMRRSSLTDLILMKLLRIKQIEDNRGKTLASEGVLANYQDIINYAVFALIKISEASNLMMIDK